MCVQPSAAQTRASGILATDKVLLNHQNNSAHNPHASSSQSAGCSEYTGLHIGDSAAKGNEESTDASNQGDHWEEPSDESYVTQYTLSRGRNAACPGQPQQHRRPERERSEHDADRNGRNRMHGREDERASRQGAAKQGVRKQEAKEQPHPDLVSGE